MINERSDALEALAHGDAAGAECHTMNMLRASVGAVAEIGMVGGLRGGPKAYSNRHGQLTNGRYVLDEAKMAPHMTGTLADGKSQFLYRVNAKQLTLDAAVYADDAGLWNGSKAKVVFDEYIGVHARTGQLTNVLNIYRTHSRSIHAAPGRPLP